MCMYLQFSVEIHHLEASKFALKCQTKFLSIIQVFFRLWPIDTKLPDTIEKYTGIQAFRCNFTKTREEAYKKKIKIHVVKVYFT